ncbi:MAG: hypothetical protein AVDCRST_MAG04-622, partial [uncultured Acetobacteraceae bacterium]
EPRRGLDRAEPGAAAVVRTVLHGRLRGVPGARRCVSVGEPARPRPEPGRDGARARQRPPPGRPGRRDGLVRNQPPALDQPRHRGRVGVSVRARPIPPVAGALARRPRGSRPPSLPTRGFDHRAAVGV